MSRWSDEFTPASWSGASWGDGDYTDGELGPEDQLMHHLEYKLSGDAKLSAIFGAKIEVMDRRPGPDIRNLPRLYLYSGTTQPSEAPTKLDVETNAIFVGVVYGATSVSAVARGDATLATVLHRIKGVMRANQEMTVTVNGTQVQMARLGLVQPHQTIQILDESGRLFAEMQELEIDYTIDVDRDTQRILNVVNA